MPKEILVYGRTAEVLTGGTNQPTTMHPNLPTPEFSLHWQAQTADHLPAWGQVGCTVNVELIRQRLADVGDAVAITFMSEVIERAEFQRSIKALRRARDTIFGADE